MKAGQRVMVWYDTPQKDDQEGVAILISQACSTPLIVEGEAYECWWVQFENEETGKWLRWVSSRDEVHESQER